MLNKNKTIRVKKELLIICFILLVGCETPLMSIPSQNLKDLVTKLQSESLEIKAAQDQVQIAKWQYQNHVSKFAPQIDLNFTKLYQKGRSRSNKIPASVQSQFDFDIDDIDSDDDAKMSLKLNQTLYNNGKNLHQIDISDLNIKKSIINRHSKINDQLFELIKSYYNYLIILKKIEVAETQFETKIFTRKKALERYKVGKISKFDYLSAEVDYKETELALLTLKHDKETALLTIRLIFNGQDVLITEDIPKSKQDENPYVYLGKKPFYFERFTQIKEEISLNNSPLRTSPQIRLADIDTQIAKSNYIQAIRNIVPRVYLLGSYDLDFSNRLNNKENSQVDKDWQISLNLSLNLFDGLTRWREVKDKSLKLNVSKRSVDLAIQKTSVSVQKMLLQIQTIEQKMKLNQALIKRSGQRRKTAIGQFNAGIIHITDLNKAEWEHRKTMNEFAEEIANYYTTIALLLKEIGIPLSTSGQWN